MSLTVYDDLLLPESIVAAGIRGKNRRSNNRVTSTNGQMQINVQSDRTLRQFELGVVPLTLAQWAQIEALHEVTEGGAFGFLLSDPKDHTTQAGQGYLQAADGQLLLGTVGQGYGVPTYRLIKRYTIVTTSRFKDRLITRLQPDLQVQKNGVNLSAGSGPNQYSVSSTGVATIHEDASAYLDSATVGATTTLDFGGGNFASLFAVGGRIWLQGVSGTASTVLADQAHEILSISGNSMVINTATTGLTLTGALAKRYPQPSDSLTWHGQFYVPVHFMDDDIDWEMVLAGNDESRLVAGPNVVLQEVRE